MFSLVGVTYSGRVFFTFSAGVLGAVGSIQYARNAVALAFSSILTIFVEAVNMTAVAAFF